MELLSEEQKKLLKLADGSLGEEVFLLPISVEFPHFSLFLFNSMIKYFILV
jgi:hypothetical protein